MGLITSTGFFKYIPPNPKITSISSPTGNLGDTISIFGTDLDYVDDLYFGEDNLNFAILDNFQKIEFQVPFDPNTGVLEIKSNSFELTGDNKISFLPIFQIEDFNPKSASETDNILISGKVLNSIISGNFYANLIIDDIVYYFSGNRNVFPIDTSRKISSSTSILVPEKQSVILVSSFNDKPEINNFRTRSIEDFNLSSGHATYLEFGKSSNLDQKYYEAHLFQYALPLSSSNIRAGSLLLSSGYSTHAIGLTSGFNNSNYSVFYNSVFSGDVHYYSFIKNKTANSFEIEFSNSLTKDIIFDFIALQNTGFVYNGGVYDVKSVDLPINYGSYEVNFQNDKLYKPFLFTSLEKISGQSIGSSYIGTNLYDFQNNKFSIQIPNASTGNSLRLNYFTLMQSGTNLSTFLYDTNTGYFKKMYLVQENANSSQLKVPITNLTILNKNLLSAEIPSTEYHINGKIELFNSTGINKSLNIKFVEVPSPTDVLPKSGFRGSNILIQGKSFKKPILIDGTGEYNSVIVRFRYADDIYLEKKNTFEADFVLINKDLLSGKIPIKNIPTGRYALQMITEDGSLFE